MSWRRTARKWAAQQSRTAQRVVAQGFDRARQAGRVTARKVLAIQQAAHLPSHLMRRSAMSVETRQPARHADAAWRDGYMQQVQKQAPGLTPGRKATGLGVDDREAYAVYPTVRTNFGPEADLEAGQ
jgi:hypothetical protein